MALPTDITSAPNYTAAQHATHHNSIHTHVNSGVSGTSPVILAETTLSAVATYIEFASISQSYKHLWIEGRLRSDRAATSNDAILLQVGNGSIDTGASSYSEALFVNFVADTVDDTTAFVEIGKAPAATAVADSWAHIKVSIEDYTGTTYHRMIRSDVFARTDAANVKICDCLGKWTNTASAIDVVRLSPGTGPNWIAGSRVRLIGIPAP